MTDPEGDRCSNCYCIRGIRNIPNSPDHLNTSKPSRVVRFFLTSQGTGCNFDDLFRVLDVLKLRRARARTKGACLFGKFSFRGGVHPPNSKGRTESQPIEVLPLPEKVILPISQHIGAPAKVTVNKGDIVRRGDLVAESGGFVSANIHASISGKVTAVADNPHPLGRYVAAIEIENDGNDTASDTLPPIRNWREAAPSEVVRSISAAGIVGMGGASFPTHVKLSPPPEKRIDTLIINGAECEPYLTADHRLMLEKTLEVLTGTLILKKTVGASKVYLAIEDNKPDAIATISQFLSRDDFKSITLAKLRTKYPQGGEKQLINAVTRRQVPSGGLPMDCGCVVQNVGTAYAVYQAIAEGIPLYERVVTITGPLVKNPGNLLVRIGTPLRTVLEYCQADLTLAHKVVMGGPMMGLAQSELDAPVIKSTSGILVLDSEVPAVKAHDCISCGNCVKVCPVHLVPSMLAKYIDKEQHESAEEWNVLDCMECGSCSFVCPSKINLVHFMKLGKFHVMAARKKAKV